MIHGANYGVFDVEGATVASVQASLADAFVNRKLVPEEYRLRTQDDLVFGLLEGRTARPVRDLPGAVLDCCGDLRRADRVRNAAARSAA